VDLYSTVFVVPHTQGAQAWITQFYLQWHECLPLLRKHSPDGTSTDWGGGHLVSACTHLSAPKGWKRGWLTYSRWFTHISGHPSDAGLAQDRESVPVKDE